MSTNSLQQQAKSVAKNDVAKSLKKLIAEKACRLFRHNQSLFKQTDKKYWKPNPVLLEKVSALIPPGAKVLEIGPGRTPFPRATHFVDLIGGPNVTACDINTEPLPFADKTFDFVYCRHVLEDVYNPFLLCREMARVGKAGYIETPSPLAELARGIDSDTPPWRGYHHHRYFVWTENEELVFTPKYPIIEHLDFDEIITQTKALRDGPQLWNTAFLWRDTFSTRVLRHDFEYTIYDTYRDILLDAAKAGVRNAAQMGLV